MTGMGMGSTYLERPRPGGLAEVIDIILDKGLVIDVFLRVSVLGLELLTVDARIVVASIDTYLRFAEAVDRLTLQSGQGTRLADLFGGVQEEGARAKLRGGIGGAIEGVKESVGVDKDSDREARQPERAPRRNGRSGR